MGKEGIKENLENFENFEKPVETLPPEEQKFELSVEQCKIEADKKGNCAGNTKVWQENEKKLWAKLEKCVDLVEPGRKKPWPTTNPPRRLPHEEVKPET